MSQDTSPAPARQKGPLVWLDMDQNELDDAYDQTVYAPNQPFVAKRRDVATEKARKALGAPKRLKYGPTEIEGMDLYATKAPNAPIAVYIHGGAWRNGVSANFAQPAEMLVHAGVHYIAVDFANIDTVGGSLFPMVDQVRRAVAWVHKNAREFGGDPSQLYVLGHSSGGHLAGCVCVTDWAKDYGLPATGVIKAATLCSGMYDLTPVRLSKRSKYVNFTDEMVAKLSSIRHLDKFTFPLLLGYGTCETPEFQRQAREFSAALKAAGKPHELVVGDGYNHFEMFETFESKKNHPVLRPDG